jgi:hypothetical protein
LVAGYAAQRTAHPCKHDLNLGALTDPITPTTSTINKTPIASLRVGYH